MKITTEMIEDELFESHNVHGNTASIDMRESAFKTGFSLVEMLQSSVAACAGVDIIAMLRKRRKTIVAFSIETESVRQENVPRWLKSIHSKYKITSPDVTELELTKITRLALEKYCSVASSLKSEITFSVEITRP